MRNNIKRFSIKMSIFKILDEIEYDNILSNTDISQQLQAKNKTKTKSVLNEYNALNNK